MTEILKIILAWTVQMKWILIIVVGLLIAYSRGMGPENIMEWILEMVRTVAGNG